MTSAQKKWLRILDRDGFVEWGWNFRNGQRNRPLRKLESMGYAENCLGPEGSFLKCQGVKITPEGREAATKLKT